MAADETGGQAAPPAFESRDPAAPGFWDERFARGYTPWDQRGVPAAFAAFAEGQPRGAVLIPGCGSAYEAGWLAGHGFAVTALDFAAAAVEAARAQLAQAPAGASVELLQADFFAFEPSRPPQWIYERAFLCALPPALRADYARRMAELVAPGTLLAGFFLIGEPAQKGPPFSMTQAELDALLTPYFDCVAALEVADSLPVFAGRERWLSWRRRG
jgi:hypothetical protein